MFSGLLPVIGLEIPVSGHAVEVPFKMHGVDVAKLDFKGGIRRSGSSATFRPVSAAST
ncbi:MULTISPECIES: hypothetical protein [Sorangium]|uniref:hypothetical protein n=1 Tax=Sorangium TaxID=39643 RepID=UPI003D9C1784